MHGLNVPANTGLTGLPVIPATKANVSKLLAREGVTISGKPLAREVNHPKAPQGASLVILRDMTAPGPVVDVTVTRPFWRTVVAYLAAKHPARVHNARMHEAGQRVHFGMLGEVAKILRAHRSIPIDMQNVITVSDKPP